MTTSDTTARDLGPLILGSCGRVGRAFRHLHDAGHWSGPSPVWHRRRTGTTGDYAWDMLASPPPTDPRLARVRGMIVLAGGAGGSAPAEDNVALARAAIALARRDRIAPVLICSSQAVYGRAEGPQAEDAATTPVNAYGTAKRAMEIAVAQEPDVCCLRIGNVAGMDMLLMNAARGPVRLDRFADGTGPRRCYIGPVSLARTMVALICAFGDGIALPPVLNLAAPGDLPMEDLLSEAGADWGWTPAPATALPALTLDLTRLSALVPLPASAGTARTLIQEARAAGWSVGR